MIMNKLIYYNDDKFIEQNFKDDNHKTVLIVDNYKRSVVITTLYYSHTGDFKEKETIKIDKDIDKND